MAFDGSPAILPALIAGAVTWLTRLPSSTSSNFTTIGVPQLARPGAVIEIEAIAILPPK